MQSRIEPEFNREQAFLLYATFTGDLTRTAAALGVKPVDVLRIADEDEWNDKLKPILDLKKSTAPGDMERAINRALNFVQARRTAMLLERTLTRLCNMPPEELDEYLFHGNPDKEGNTTKKLTTRALADLATAIEKVHCLTYLALSDTVADRTRRKETAEGEVSGGEMHARIAEAMSKVRNVTSPRGVLFEAQLAVAQERKDAADRLALALLPPVKTPEIIPPTREDRLNSDNH